MKENLQSFLQILILLHHISSRKTWLFVSWNDSISASRIEICIVDNWCRRLTILLLSLALTSRYLFPAQSNVYIVRHTKEYITKQSSTYFSAFFWAFSALFLALFFFLLLLLLLFRGSPDCFVGSGNLNALLVVEGLVVPWFCVARFRRYHTAPTTAATRPTNRGVWGVVSCFFFFFVDLQSKIHVRIIKERYESPTTLSRTRTCVAVFPASCLFWYYYYCKLNTYLLK